MSQGLGVGPLEVALLSLQAWKVHVGVHACVLAVFQS